MIRVSDMEILHTYTDHTTKAGDYSIVLARDLNVDRIGGHPFMLFVCDDTPLVWLVEDAPTGPRWRSYKDAAVYFDLWVAKHRHKEISRW